MTDSIFDFFGLRGNPFCTTSDLHYFIFNRQARAAWDELLYGIQNRKGLLVLTGEIGAGKTTLLRSLVDWLRHRGFPVALVVHSLLDSADLVDLVLSDFQVTCSSRSKSEQLIALNRWLVERYRSGRIPVLLIDEAQGLSPKVLEEIGLLMNLETPREKLLQVVLAGQPELEETLRLPELRQLYQCIAVRSRVLPLSCEETLAYVHDRLRRAGSRHPELVFLPEASEAIYRHSRGIPRVVNILCEHALIHCYAAGAKPVRAETVAEVARDFQFADCFVPPIADRIGASLDVARPVATSISEIADAATSSAIASASALDFSVSAPQSVPARPLPSRQLSASAPPPPPHPASAPQPHPWLRPTSASRRPLKALLNSPSRFRADFPAIRSWLLSGPGAKRFRVSSRIPYRAWLSSLLHDWKRMIAPLLRWLQEPSNSGTSAPPRSHPAPHRPVRHTHAVQNPAARARAARK